MVQTDKEAVEVIAEILQGDKQLIIKECRESIVRFDLRKYIQKIEKLIDSL